MILKENWLSELRKWIAAPKNSSELRRIANEIVDSFPRPESLAQSYVEPWGTKKSPSLGDDCEQKETVVSLLNSSFTETLHGKGASGRNRVFLLSGTGMGKTSLLVMLYLAAEAGLWKSSSEHFFFQNMGGRGFSLSSIPVEKRGRSTLFLDSLDELSISLDKFEEKLHAILQEVEDFFEVIISCRTQFLPEEIEMSASLMGEGYIRVSEFHYPAIYLVPFDDGQIESYLEMRYPDKWYQRFFPCVFKNDKRLQASTAISTVREIFFRPLLLSYIDYWLPSFGDKVETVLWEGDFQIYRRLVDILIRREAGADKRCPPRLLWDAYFQIALSIQSQKSLTLTEEQLISCLPSESEYEPVPFKNGDDPQPPGDANLKGIFSSSEILELVNVVIDAGGCYPNSFLSHLPRRLQAGVKRYDLTRQEEFEGDLCYLNKLDQFVEGKLPIEGWFGRAESLFNTTQQETPEILKEAMKKVEERKKEMLAERGNSVLGQFFRNYNRASKALLERTPDGKYHFFHRSFQEFLVVNAIIECKNRVPTPGTIKGTSVLLDFLKTFCSFGSGGKKISLAGLDVSDLDLRPLGSQVLERFDFELVVYNEHTDWPDSPPEGVVGPRCDLRGRSMLCFSAEALGEVDLQGAKYDDETLWPPNFDFQSSGAFGPGACLSGVDLSGIDLSEVDLSGADLSGVHLEEANLEGVNLEGADLKGANLEGANLKGANFKGANLKGARFDRYTVWPENFDELNSRAFGPRADLKGGCFKEEYLKNIDFTEVNLEGANLEGVNLEGAKLQNASLVSACLQGAALWQTNLEEADLREANLMNADLELADCRTAVLERANLQYTNLRNVDFQDANLRYAQFQGADFEGVNLKGANLEGCNLDQAVLKRAIYDSETLWPPDFDFQSSGAFGPGACLSGVDLSGVDLSGASLEGGNFHDILFDSSTIWPEGFSLPSFIQNA